MRQAIVFLLLSWTLGAGAHAQAVELFWNDLAGIHRTDRAGDPGVLLFETFDTRGLALDASARRVYWTDILPIVGPLPPGTIRAGRFEGGPFESLVTRLDQPSGIAVDSGRGRIFWTDLGDETHASSVYVSNLDGSGPKQLISGPSLSEIAGIAVDRLHEKIYFTYINPLIDGLFPGAIGRANFDGSELETIVSGLGQPLGIAIDVVGDGLFWADARTNPAVGGGAILAATLDGKHQRTIIGGLDSPYGIALDLAARDVYWSLTKAGVIQRTEMSGILPFFQTVLSGLESPTAIAIVPEPSTLLLLFVGAAGFRFLRKRFQA